MNMKQVAKNSQPGSYVCEYEYVGSGMSIYVLVVLKTVYCGSREDNEQSDVYHEL